MIKVIKLKPIGYVHRATTNENVKDRNLEAEIVIRRGFSEALEGIEDFSHIFVLFYMHKVSTEDINALKVHPRGRSDMPLVGIYATRAPIRPNPIGLVVVELRKRKENILVVRGLDAFDGTPVLDLKPYDSWDAVINIKVPAWRRNLETEVISDRH